MLPKTLEKVLAAAGRSPTTAPTKTMPSAQVKPSGAQSRRPKNTGSLD